MKKHLISTIWLVFTFGTILGQEKVSQPGYYRLKLGQIEVTALSDGTVPIDAAMLFPAGPPETIASLLKHAYINNPVEISINSYLIKTDSKLILVDVGSGEGFGPSSGGQLLLSLKNAGYQASQITDILITHIHLDHSGGLTVNNKMVFPNATIHVNQKDIDFWLDHNDAKAGEDPGITNNRPGFVAVKPYLEARKVKTFQGNITLFPGITTLESLGHSFGHTQYVLQSNNLKLVFWGDLVHLPAVQLNSPAIPDEFDFQKDKAAAERQKAYEAAAKDHYLIAAPHISFPGIGRVRASGNGFDWVPIAYSLSGTK